MFRMQAGIELKIYYILKLVFCRLNISVRFQFQFLYTLGPFIQGEIRRELSV